MIAEKNKKYDYGQALELMKEGYLMTRDIWPDICCCAYQKGYQQGIPCNEQTAHTWNIPVGSLFVCNPYLQKRIEDGTYSMWQPTLEDLLAEDWIVKE